jgi:hypothetical protein
MTNDYEIRERAYALWEKNGRPEGFADKFWQQAREQLQAERHQKDDPESFSGGMESSVTPPKPKSPRRSRK